MSRIVPPSADPMNANANTWDHKVRVVSLLNLEAMCEHVSGVSHTFEIVKIALRCVHVEYSNPDEYGNPHPVVAVYPTHILLPGYENRNNESVILQAVKYIGCTGRNEEAWQAFHQLEDCEEMVRDPQDRSKWMTVYECLIRRHPEYACTSTWDKDGCIQTWHCHGQDFRCYRDAHDWAIQEIRKL